MLDENFSKCPSKEVLITMLRFALIEIRSADEIEVSHKLADIFHILPAQLLKDWDAEINEKAYSQILSKARKWGMEKYILDLVNSAEDSLNRRP